MLFDFRSSTVCLNQTDAARIADGRITVKYPAGYDPKAAAALLSTKCKVAEDGAEASASELAL